MLERGRYGVEWTPRPDDGESTAIWRVLAAVAAIALVSLGWTLVNRFRAKPEEPPPAPPAQAAAPAHGADREPAPAPQDPAAQTADGGGDAPQTATFQASEVPRLGKRPPKVRNLLMRLEEAERMKDTEMAVTTIEALRALPGSPAADLDNDLALRLGTLNMRRLFEQKCAQWVETVTVKSGDSASRIASEHGATFASLAKLNSGDVGRIRVGQKLYVMNHPRFNLVVRVRSRTADLQLNGKFFKRYDLTDERSVKAGAFEWREVSLPLKPADRAELDLLLPKSTSVLVSEI